ncbi:hypothetical protein GCM10009422_28920 [Brevundimonas kwangchunensis]|uniref:Uncharacterized protein n=1 Tax=Brevundimonas kwangchunensis TaxID=322163 RepID=A0ABP3SE69_9CAUL
MTAVDTSRRTRATRRGLKGVAGVLTFVCTVLFLLAIEQKQAVEAWAAIRDGAVPAVQRMTSWVADGASDGVSGLKQAAQGADRPLAAAADADVVLAGEFAPADEATRETVGGAAFVRSLIQLESGDVFRTRPLRIAAGRERFVHDGQTFAARFGAPADAQIELRQIVPHARQQAVAPTALCGGEVPGAVALLHRRGRVDMMLFRARTVVGADAPAGSLCGVWSFRER